MPFWDDAEKAYNDAKNHAEKAVKDGAYHAEKAVRDGAYHAERAAKDVQKTVCGGYMNPDEVARMDRLRAWIQDQGIKENFKSEVPLFELAQMCSEVYALNKGKIKRTEVDGWVLSDQMQQGGWTGDYPDNLAMAVYTNDSKRIAVLALKGTDTDSHSDWHLDMRTLMGGTVPEQPVKSAVNLLKKYNGTMKLMVTGHSLGAYMAETLASHLGIGGAAFCAPGPGWHLGDKGGDGKGFAVINVHNDPIIDATDWVPFKTSAHGYSVKYVHCGKNHAIDSVRDNFGGDPSTNRHF